MGRRDRSLASNFPFVPVLDLDRIDSLMYSVKSSVVGFSRYRNNAKTAKIPFRKVMLGTNVWARRGDLLLFSAFSGKADLDYFDALSFVI